MEKKLLSFYGCLIMLVASACHAIDLAQIQKLPYPYSSVTELLPFNNHGWYSNGPWIEGLMKNNDVRTVVEIGSWLGLSTRHIASLLPENGVLYAIDTWEGSIEHQDTQLSGMLPILYQQFLSNIIHSGFTRSIVPLKMTSQEAVSVMKNYGDHFDLIYIDAAHDTESVYKDIVAYYPFVAGDRGILCGDDWWWESVRVAVLQFAQEHALTVYADYSTSNFWFLKNEGQFQVKSSWNLSDEAWKFSKK